MMKNGLPLKIDQAQANIPLGGAASPMLPHPRQRPALNLLHPIVKQPSFWTPLSTRTPGR
jgi:hypothetical protein